ncbi:hypothetical protein MBLNU459_g1791t1 [Dothideomycetes sp. NU459]
MSNFTWNVPNHTHPASPPPTPSQPKPTTKSPPSIVPIGQPQPPILGSPLGAAKTARRFSGITIEELSEKEDLGYASDIEVVHPDELEEPDSASETSDTPGSDDKRDSDSAIVSSLRRLRCRDDAGGRGPRRQQQQQQPPTDSSDTSSLKRTHSETMGTDTEVESVDGLDDQDRKSSARRLRRRVRGPADPASSFVFEDLHAAPLSDIGEQTGNGNDNDDDDDDDDEALFDSPQASSQPPSLPYWVLEDPMDIDSSSQSRPASAGC